MKAVIFKGLFIILVFVSLLLLLLPQKDKNQNDNQIAENTNEVYIVSEYRGKIAVFREDESVPLTIYDSYVSHLPQHDRELLKNGIKAENSEELQKIIEDYTS